MRPNPILLLLALLSAPLSALSAEAIEGKLIFAVEEVGSSEPNAGSGRPYTDRTGIFHCCKESGPGECQRDSIAGYGLINGKRIGSVARNQELLEDLKAMPLSSFDVRKEIDSTIVKWRAEAAKNYTSFPGWFTRSGAKYRILYDFNGVYIDYTDRKPNLGIRILAAYSPNLKNLNDCWIASPSTTAAANFCNRATCISTLDQEALNEPQTVDRRTARGHRECC